jgi:hypothetical protein
MNGSVCTGMGGAFGWNLCFSSFTPEGVSPFFKKPSSGTDPSLEKMPP